MKICVDAELFTKFGGHPMAAGVIPSRRKVEKFRRKINENCPLTVEEVCPDIHIDMAMPVGYASTELIHQFALLEPFGKDNPSPLFADRNLSISRMWVIGKEPECSSDECSFGIRTAGSGYFLWGCGDVVCIFYRKVWSGRGGECAEWQKKPDFIFYGVHSKD